MKKLVYKIVENPATNPDRYMEYDIIAKICCCQGCSGDLMYGTTC